jgi:hypothetical protein
MNSTTNKQSNQKRTIVGKRFVSVPNIVAKNMFLNARMVKAQMVMDCLTKSSEHYSVTTDMMRTLRNYPLGFDFSMNLLQSLKEINTLRKRMKYNPDDEYTRIRIFQEDMTNYLKHFSNSDIRQTFRNRLYLQLHPSFMISENEKSIIKYRPFELKDEMLDKDTGEWSGTMEFAANIFKAFLDGSMFARNGCGYTEIPKNLFPRVTNADKGIFKSYNPIYKLMLYAAMRNTNRSKEIDVSLKDLINVTCPEYLDKRGYLEIKLSPKESEEKENLNCETSFNQAIESLKDHIKEGLLLNNVSFIKKEDVAILKFKYHNNRNTA